AIVFPDQIKEVIIISDVNNHQAFNYLISLPSDCYGILFEAKSIIKYRVNNPALHFLKTVIYM
ncbi:7336_t:CDS:2, partial [Entrophospora sp. SA101]